MQAVNGTSTKTVPFEVYEELHGHYEEAIGELAATRRALSVEHARAVRLKRQLEDERNEGTDSQVVLKWLRWWRDETGRPQTTRIDLTTKRAHRTRWALKHWEPRELCYMVRGAMNDPWWASRGLTDVLDILKDERRAEKFLELGRPGS